MAETTPCSQCGTLVPADIEFCPNCNFYMSWAKDPEDEESAARSPRLPDEEVAPKPAPTPEPFVESGDPCPRCQVPNAPARVYCRRCGHDLRAPAVRPVPLPVQPKRPAWLIPAIVGAIVVVAVVLWIVFTAGGDDPAAPETTEAAEDTPTSTSGPEPTVTTAAPVVEALGSDRIAVMASSALPDDAYQPDQMLDGALDTAWNHCGTGCDVTGDTRQGIGVTLRFDFDQPVVLTGFRLANGYQKVSETIGDVWLKNNRIRQVLVTTAAGSETIEIEDVRGYQTVQITPVDTSFLIIEVLQVYEGDGTYNDLAVSEIELLVEIG